MFCKNLTIFFFLAIYYCICLSSFYLKHWNKRCLPPLILNLASRVVKVPLIDATVAKSILMYQKYRLLNIVTMHIKLPWHSMQLVSSTLSTYNWKFKINQKHLFSGMTYKISNRNVSSIIEMTRTWSLLLKWYVLSIYIVHITCIYIMSLSVFITEFLCIYLLSSLHLTICEKQF